jgi:hypothetical protein
MQGLSVSQSLDLRRPCAVFSHRVTKWHIGWLRVHVERSMQAVLRYNLGMPN